MRLHVLSTFALVFYKCEGGSGSVLRHCQNKLPTDVVLFRDRIRGCTASEPLFIITPQMGSPKACVVKAAILFCFSEETVNWPGYGLLQLNLKH